MLLINSHILDVVQIVVTSLIGMFAISGGIEGFMKKPMPWWQRILSVAAGLALIDPGLATDLCGIVVIAFIIVLQYFVREKKTALPDGPA